MFADEVDGKRVELGLGRGAWTATAVELADVEERGETSLTFAAFRLNNSTMDWELPVGDRPR